MHCSTKNRVENGKRRHGGGVSFSNEYLIKFLAFDSHLRRVCFNGLPVGPDQRPPRNLTFDQRDRGAFVVIEEPIS